MDRVFSFRLDDLMGKKLRSLAEQTYRTRGSVLRLLILNANVHKDLVPPITLDCQKSVLYGSDNIPSLEREKEREP